MSRKLFVGGLSWNTTDEGLRAAFGRFGVVSEAKVVLDRETGRSRGFGFVAFQNPADSEAARAAMDGATLDQRQIRVSVAEDKPRGPRPERGSEGAGQGPRSFEDRGGPPRAAGPRPGGMGGGERQGRFEPRPNFDRGPAPARNFAAAPARNFAAAPARNFAAAPPRNFAAAPPPPSSNEGRGRRDRDRDRGRDHDDGEGRAKRRGGRGRRRHEDGDGDLDLDY